METITISRGEYEALKSENAELNQKVEWLMEQLRLVRKKQFGASSEKTEGDAGEQLRFLFNEAEAYAAPPGPKKVTQVAAHVRKQSGSVKDVAPENIPVEVIEHRLAEEERQCPRCGETMGEIGKEVRETLVLVPAKAVLRQEVYYTYACKNCEENEETDGEKEDVSTPVLKTPREPSVLPGSFASPEAIAHIMVQKFVMGNPLYRQLIKREVLHADETTLQVLREPGKEAQTKSQGSSESIWCADCASRFFVR